MARTAIFKTKHLCSNHNICLGMVRVKSEPFDDPPEQQHDPTLTKPTKSDVTNNSK